MWCDKELEKKRKLRYYKDVIYPNLEDQNYLSIFPIVKKKISIAKKKQILTSVIVKLALVNS
jgi:hypothetical protein